MKIGDRAKFVGKDDVFHFGEREGKTGTIVADARLDTNGSNFGGGSCFWQIDGDNGWYCTSFSHLELV